ncbi:MAG: CYTH domain-containing protein [Candidatus Bathyarchaeia archaeon]|jgi:predicted adenylyl cyclase CyaB
MKEIEIKIIEIDRKKVEDNLATLGAAKTFDGDVETWFFDFQDNTITRARNLLRLRRIGDKTDLTFKKFVESQSAKVRHEYEVSISDFETMCLILESLGLISTWRMEKHRTSYVLSEDVHVDIDRYSGEFSHIPELMEIEGGDISTIREHAKLLGFGPDDCKSWDTFDLVDHYSGKKARDNTHGIAPSSEG